MSRFDAWVFDLDNTLYPVGDIYDAIGARMTAYIARKLGLDDEAAHALRERYLHQYGATVVGVVEHHDFDARDFLADAHDTDYSVLSADPELAELIAALPGRRIIFTNSGGGHAQRALERLGLASLFEAVIDIEAMGLKPKPQREPYERLVRICDLDPRTTIMIEDTLRNLEPAHAMGFATALVGPIHPEPRPPYVDHWARDVKGLLPDLTA